MAEPNELVIKALTAAYHALRGYQYGNADPSSAEVCADYVHNALESYKVECGQKTTVQGEAESTPWPTCPITRRPFFMNMDHPDMGEVPTFGGPFDSYTIPEVDDDGQLQCERYDHDAGAWIEGGEPTNIYLTTGQPPDGDLPAFLGRTRRAGQGSEK